MHEHSTCARMLRLREVLRLFPVSRSSWFAGVRDGRYPGGHKLSARCVAWLESDILALIASKAAA